MSNYLESLAAEWYQYQGYWVHRNIRPRQHGVNHSRRELDVIALHPGRKHLVHLELSSGFFEEGELPRYAGKFAALHDVVPTLFPGVAGPFSLEQLAIWEVAPSGRVTDHGFTILSLPQFLVPIRARLTASDYMTNAVPEQFPILRTIQMTHWAIAMAAKSSSS